MRTASAAVVAMFLGWMVGPALGAEFVTAEFGTDPPVLGPARSPFRPALARAGANSMLAWQDHRGNSAGIAVARIAADGTLLDPANIVGPPGNDPALACDPAACLVVFERSKQIFGFRVGHDGALLDRTPFMIAGSSSSGAAVAFNGTDYLVAWVRESFSYTITGVRVSPAGALREMPRTLVEPLPGLPNIGSVFGELTAASDGAGWLLAFEEYTRDSSWNVSALRIDRAGMPSDPARLSLGTTADAEFRPAVSFGAGAYLVVWYVTMRTLPVMGALVPPAGTPGAPFAISPTGRSAVAPGVAFDGVNHLVVWHEGTSSDNTLHAARVSAAGAVLDPQGIALGPSFDGFGVLAAPLDAGVYVAWYDRQDGAPGVYGRRHDRSGGAAETRRLISRALNQQDAAAAAATAGGYLWTWVDLREGLGSIYAVRLGPAGQPLDPVAFAVGPSDRHQDDPAVASDGRDHLVVWRESFFPTSRTQIVARRVPAAGAPAGATAVIAAGGTAAAVAHGQGQYLVTWSDRDTGELRAARVADDGQLLDVTPIVIATGNVLRSRVASDGKGFLVIWGGGSSGVRGARLDGTGKVLDATPLVLAPAGSSSQNEVDLTFGAGAYLMIWENTGLRGARVDPATGALLDANGFLVVDEAMTLESNPILAFDGTSFLVAWKSLEYTQGTRFVGWRVALATFSAGGGPLLSHRTMASLPEQDFLLWRPALAAAGGRALVGYRKQADGPGYQYRRVYARATTSGNLAPGGRCETSQACATGLFCVDGVCCRSACAGGTADCQACSTDEGAAENGACGPVGDGRRCAGGVCGAGMCRPLPPDAGAPDAPVADAAGGEAGALVDAPAAVDGAPGDRPQASPEAAGGTPSEDASSATAADARATGPTHRAGCSCRLGANQEGGGTAALGLLLLGALAGRARTRAARAGLRPSRRAPTDPRTAG